MEYENNGMGSQGLLVISAQALTVTTLNDVTV